MKNVRHTIFGTVLFLLLTGCAGIVSKPVSDADRDVTGQYDGRYVMNIKAFKGRQQVGRAYFNCNMRAGKVNVTVADSVAKIRIGGNDFTANVDADGKFRFEVPTDRSYSNSRTGEKSVAAKITYVYFGTFESDKMKGQFVIGKLSENNNGCATGLNIESR